MTISHGADVEALRLLADEMLTHSEVCLRVALRTTAALADLSWRGPDADRARAAWASTHEPHLRETSRLVAGAARHVIDQAREQEDASSVGTGGPPPAGPAPTGSSSTGPAPAGSAPAGGATGPGTGWRGMLDRAMALAGTTATSHDLARTIGILVEEGIDLGAGGFASAEAALDAASPALRQVGRLASALGVAADAHGLLRGIEQGDYSQIVGSGGGLAIAGAGALGMGASGPVGVAWGLGHEAGTAIYDGMQGTTYGDIVRDMSDEAFRENGAWGMAQVPGILGFAAWERWVSGRHGDAGGGR
ncbi:MAG: hypothetical protein J0H73_15770 [Salana multivorans]|uniref:hypothetical protein n=1 Tax=Salana multivorans TaxID=120377 RepID=UPI0009633E1A|nr:hypothetical protein [Salana multivorans]MBN8883757.1 hypothetical protein [Salana multivorans]OJX97415.1 MAG: hypothetical protein BGO96_05750 [Micrococcales bacterium 73-15]